MVPIPLTAHAAALGLVLADIALRGLKLRVLLGANAPAWWQAVAVNAWGEAASAITPARLGGEPARFVGLRRLAVDAPSAAVALGVERLIDYALLALVTAVAGVRYGSVAVAGARRLLEQAATPTGLLLLAGLAVFVLLSIVAMRRVAAVLPSVLAVSARAVWRELRSYRFTTLALAGTLGLCSMAARVAILPVLAAHVTGISTVAVVLGSFALLYGQLLLPTPSGAVGVELGFVSLFASVLTPSSIAILLVTWRVYTLVFGAALGAGVAASAGVLHLARPRAQRSSPT